MRTNLPSTRFQRGLNRVLGSRAVSLLSYPHGVDSYLEALNPLWSTQEVKAEVESVSYLTANSTTLTLRPNANWQGFVPGQFVQFTVAIDGKRYTRCYSPANSAHRADGFIELTVKAHPEGRVSNYIRSQLCVGDIVTLSQADGEFALPSTRPERVLLISGGSGITPVMSMLRTLCDEGFTGPITFLHYAESAADMIYAAELDALARKHSNVNLVCSFNDRSEQAALSGYFCREHLCIAEPEFAQAETFLCGPPPMMDAVSQIWETEGLQAQLHKEAFTLAVPQIDTDNADGAVFFQTSDIVADNSGETLLDQAESAGLTPESGCRMGICHTCTCRKTSGKVRDIRTGEISSDEEQDIQLCVSVPVGTVALEL